MDNLTLSSGGEGVTTLSQDLHEVVGELTASKIKADNSMGKGITFIDWDTVGDTISRVHDNTSGTARSCSRPSTCPPCMSPSRLSSPSMPLAVPLVLSWTLEMVSPTVSQSMKVMPSPMLLSVLILLGVSSPTT